MLGRQPQKVDCAVDSTTSNVTVGMVFHFGHVDGEERVVGDCCVGGALAKSVPRSSSRSLAVGSEIHGVVLIFWQNLSAWR
jgi:hypothetical protein